MKKFIALALTLAFALCAFAIPTFAAPADESYNVNVNISENGAVDTVYDVDVVWTDLAFTYTFNGDSAQWNPDKHEYETKAAAEGTVGAWNKTEANITVTNHSNATLNVTATKSDEANTNGVTFALTNTTLALANAEGTAYESAPNGVIACTISGTPTTKTSVFKISTITLSFN